MARPQPACRSTVQRKHSDQRTAKGPTKWHEKFYKEANAQHGTQNSTERKLTKGGDGEAGHLQVTAPLTDAAGTEGVSANSLPVAIFRAVRNGAGKLSLDLIILKNNIGGDWQTFQVAAQRSSALEAQTGVLLV